MQNEENVSPQRFGTGSRSVVRLGADGSGLGEAVAQLDRYGFVVVDTQARNDPETALRQLASWFGLGEPYVPELYRKGAGAAFGAAFSDIKQKAGGRHPGFLTDSAQPFHVDGLLEPLGRIRTSMLYCQRPAKQGGRTVLFNASLAYRRLLDHDPEAAKTLLDPNVLERVSSLPDVESTSVTGPAFMQAGDHVVFTRFSDGTTERWHAPAGSEAAFERALDYFRSCYGQDGSEMIAAIRLEAGECLVMRNDMLSHAREAFEDDADHPRHLVRSLHLEAPGDRPCVIG